MRKSAAAVTDFIADPRQRRGLNRQRFALLSGKIEQRAIAAEPVDEIQVAQVPEVQSGRGGERKIRENGEHPRGALPGCDRPELFFGGRHCAIS